MTEIVSISLAELLDESVDLDPRLERAYGPQGLGVLTVSGVSDVLTKRSNLLPLAQELAVRVHLREAISFAALPASSSVSVQCPFTHIIFMICI